MTLPESPSPSRHERYSRRWIIAALAALILAVSLAGRWWLSRQTAWNTSSGRAIASVIRGTIDVNENLLTPPPAYRNVRLSAAALDRLAQRAHRQLSRYYIGRLLVTWRRIAAATYRPRYLPPGRTLRWMVTWRVDWIHFNRLTVARRQATATAMAESRSNAGVLNRVDYTFHLVRTKRGWRVNQEISRFEPGYGP